MPGEPGHFAAAWTGCRLSAGFEGQGRIVCRVSSRPDGSFSKIRKMLAPDRWADTVAALLKTGQARLAQG